MVTKAKNITENLSIAATDRFFTDSIIPKIVTSAVRTSPKTQAQIASELKINANLITMFKQGRTKVPIGRAAEIAKALDIDESQFVRLILVEHHSDILNAIEDTFVVSHDKEETKAFKEARENLK